MPHRLAAVCILLLTASVLAQDVVSIGTGGYVTKLPPGAKGPQADISRTFDLKGPMPTNDWWSSLAWMKFSERQYPHPLAVCAQPQGLRIFYPASITANKDAIFGFMPERVADDLILGNAKVEKFDEARVAAFSDWFVTAQFEQISAGMSVTYGHGSPFVYAIFHQGEARISSAKPAAVWSGSEKSAILGVTINGKPYALFGPTGSTWSGIGSTTLQNHAAGKSYFSLALLPDPSEKTLALFTRHAYAHVIASKAEPAYDTKTATLTTTFTFTTKAYEGNAKGTLFALYPHQWRNTKTPLTDATYQSVRGLMKLGEGEFFVTTMQFPGVLPALPISPGVDKAQIAGLIKPEAAAPIPRIRDTYAEGKWLGKLATLIPIAEEARESAASDTLRAHLRTRLEEWLKPGERKQALFYYDKNWGTLIGYPASFGSDQELNDHHFHYGYFLKAAAEIARRDPAWAADDQWGGMIKLLIRDIASSDRADPLFPYLRNFDPYAGHSWASGHARFGDGNNNESSSEAMNAWCGMILLGEAINDQKLRDLGIYLFTTEMNAIQEYWFDVHGDTHPAAYTPSVVTMIWGGKGANGTWFSNRPSVVHGINFLPIHAGSLYLGLYPDYAAKNYHALVAENKSDTFTEWPDIIWMYRALSNPDDALRLYQSAGENYRSEAGNSRANTYYWITTLQTLGQVDRTITANHPLYAVFTKAGKKTYTAYNMHDTPLRIQFSDGFTLKSEKKGFVIGMK